MCENGNEKWKRNTKCFHEIVCLVHVKCQGKKTLKISFDIMEIGKEPNEKCYKIFLLIFLKKYLRKAHFSMYPLKYKPHDIGSR